VHTLIVWGTGDLFFPLRWARRLADLILGTTPQSFTGLATNDLQTRVILTNTQEIMAVALQQKWVDNAVGSGRVRFGTRSLVGRRHRMVRHEGGRWDVGIEDNAVYLERISESDEELFDDLLAPEEARRLAGLLTKYADKLDESDDSDDSGQSDESNDSEDSEDSEDSDDSGQSDESKDSEDSDESSD
jgi:hypothetical protein